MSTEIKQKKQDLGIFYTDQRIVSFIYDILSVWKAKEDEDLKRWESRKPHAHYPSVIDPACGEGIFLKKAVESGFTGYNPTHKVPYIFGIDIDESVVDKWESVELLNFFHEDRRAMKNHFYGQNGLLNLPNRKLPYKKMEDGLVQFDAVVGNPPYGGIGLKEEEMRGKLAASLLEYEIWKYAFDIQISKQGNMFGSMASQKDIVNRLRNMPIEILFLERFIQLAKPGGWIAIIIPDGILTNSNSHYVREFVSEKARVEAIVSLPRDAFKNVGTTAKTSILFLQKYKDQGKERDLNYPVFLASVESLEEKYFKIIKDAYQKHYTKI
ncbi:MAG: N-6 DNA methylase [Candidatus Niyogibacteria bacterium]|nr:MAG: N-6 DNA methylase [Candidatus Niyogibacteria bacterium]